MMRLPASPALMIMALLTFAADAAHAQSAASLQRAARSAEAAYERAMRWRAPATFSGSSGECVEVVGRFCLTFDTLRKPPKEPERGEVTTARERAIAAARAYFRVATGELSAAGPLVRLLLEAARAPEGVAVAREYAAATDSTTWGYWLLGYAMHAAGDDAAAQQQFDSALQRVSRAEREALLDIEWLLDPDERARVRRLTPAAREAYEQYFWRIADARLGTDVNETRVQHLARHVEARLRSRIPRVVGMASWGRDLEQLLVRYGNPVARERVLGGPGRDDSYLEHFDTSGLAFAPRALLRDGLERPPPGERWSLADPLPRSAHAIPAALRVLPLDHQVTRYPRGDSMLVRVDASVPDSVRARRDATLLLLDRAGNLLGERRARLAAAERSVSLEVVAPRDSLAYGVELREDSTGVLYRALYAVGPLSRGALQLSDIRLTQPLPDEDSTAVAAALTDLQLQPGGAFGIEVEVHGPPPGTSYEVTAGFAAAHPPGVLARGLQWLGQRLGLSAEHKPARVRWVDQAKGGGRLILNTAAPRAPGYYYIEVQVRAGGTEAGTRRLIRVTP